MSGILRSSPATASPTPSRTKALREKRTRDPIMRVKESRVREKVYAAVQKTVKPLKASTNVLKQPMLVERNNDLRAIHSKASMALRRWFREGEVIWCALPHAIVAPGTEKITIQFWPAVIEEVALKTKAVPRKNGLDLSTTASFGHTLPLASSSAVQLDSMDEEDERGIVLESNDDPLHYTIYQWTKYKVRFLAVSHSCSINDVDVLPYQAHMPPDELIAFMTQIPPNDLHFEKEIFARFNPCPEDHPPSFSDAVSPYAMALQIASTLSSFWCLTDEVEMKYTLQASRPQPPPPALLPPAPVPVHSSLQSAIEAAGQHNAQLSDNSILLNSTLYRNVSGTTPHMSQAELQKTSTQILGIPSQSESISQTRFQGLWWGTERIWVDDIIRLKVPRRSLAPEGAANIFPPAGPGKRQLEQCLAEKRNPAEFTAGTRGVFMRLDGLMAVEVPRDDGSPGTKKAARACGMLYEIVEEDWEDPKDSKSSEPPLDNIADPASQSQQIAGPSQAGPSSSTTPAPPINAYATQQPQLDGTASSTTSLSSPNPDFVQSNLLPAAPVGYKLRPILEPGYEAVVELGLISGRYYPRILSHPQVVPAVQTAFSRSVEEGGVSSANNLWALEGLSGGYHNSVDPHKYKRSRVYMMQEADKESLIQLQNYKREKLEVMNDEDDPMEIDEMYAWGGIIY